VDPEYYKNLCWMLEHDIADVLDLTFTEELDFFGRKELVELKPGGAGVKVGARRARCPRAPPARGDARLRTWLESECGRCRSTRGFVPSREPAWWKRTGRSVAALPTLLRRFCERPCRNAAAAFAGKVPMCDLGGGVAPWPRGDATSRARR